MNIRVKPTFFLKGVDPNKIIENYRAGYYAQPRKTKQKIQISQTKSILAQTYGSSNYDPVYSVKDKNNSSVIIATTGHLDFNVYTKNGGTLPEGGRCEHCKKDFQHTAIGYPVGYEEATVLSQDSEGKSFYRVIYTFWVEGRFCGFECALGYVRLILNKSSDYRDTTIRDSERLLKLLYRLMYPEASTLLRPAQDPRLLKDNGGSLTEEEWCDKKHIYTRTDRILMIPAKVDYVKDNFINPISVIEPHN